jgi:trimeric autotransporter adhesin
MMTRRLLATTALIAAFAATPALADGNSITGLDGVSPFTQSGDNNAANIEQVGSSNAVLGEQDFGNNTMNVTQQGNSNIASLQQWGRGSVETVTQTGNNNTADVYSNPSDQDSVSQNGNGNNATIYGDLTGTYSVFFGNAVAQIGQTGDNNQASIEQSGSEFGFQ